MWRFDKGCRGIFLLHSDPVSYTHLDVYKRQGFSGLMLAVTEDLGLAEGTQKHYFDICALLTYSAVCGIGLDTVSYTHLRILVGTIVGTL